MQVDILTSMILPSALFLIMFALGISLQLANFRDVFKYPKAVCIGLFGQMIVLPLLAFAIALGLQLPAEIAVGLIIIALAPGGATSNMFTYLTKGDVALSISLTVIVSFVTPFTIPVIVALSMSYFMGADTIFQLPVIETITRLLVITLVPVVFGMLFRSLWPNVANKIEAVIKWFSVLVLFFIIILVVLSNSENMLSFFAKAGLATLILNVAALFSGYQLAKMTALSKSQSIAIGFEVGIQNGTLAMVVAGTLIGNQVMMIPAATYGLLMFVTGAMFSGWMKKRNL